MKTLQQIIISDTKELKYKTTITLGYLCDDKYNVIITTNHKGVINEFEQLCESYKEALNQYLDDIQEYAKHTALMNL